jgi:hypothetical protein
LGCKLLTVHAEQTRLVLAEQAVVRPCPLGQDAQAAQVSPLEEDLYVSDAQTPQMAFVVGVHVAPLLPFVPYPTAHAFAQAAHVVEVETPELNVPFEPPVHAACKSKEGVRQKAQRINEELGIRFGAYRCRRGRACRCS